MKREKINTLNERDILVGLIVSNKFCSEICPVIEPRLLEVEYARILVSWIKDYFYTFKKAPQKDIIKLYRSRCEEISDVNLQSNILLFTEKLIEDFESIKKFNEDFAIQQAINYLKGRSLKNLSEDIDAYLSTGKIDKAENCLVKYKTLEKSSGEVVSILNNKNSIIDSFTEENNVLFSFPGAYGKVVGEVCREDFIAFLAPMKRGKTFALVDAGVTALQHGLKVLHISLEMSVNQMIKRYWTAITGDISKTRDDINFPYFEPNGDKWEVASKTITRESISINEIEKKQKNLKRLFRGGDIRIVSVPNYSLTVEELEVLLDKLLQEENFVPDVIIVDYADIMKPSDRADYRQQIDGIWKRLRGLAQSRKVVVFTASQSGRGSLSRDAEAQDTAEDIRKIAHITSMVVLNQTAKEKRDGIIRVKNIAIREGESEYREVVCTQCLSIARMFMDSRFADEVILDKEEDDFEYEEKPKKKSKKNRL